ncbi:glycosyltransferase family 2 protein [Actinomycetospora lemnae]|uniref:Glycosyltransferase family 2 protein n=1 Tax=Actinomycetospora lemnae TaxID=3019891 RepID=A0ABT5SVH7_9PSEU|nr:glycosyltransferase family 2 protein [Actinomycetospora sp. DW7H6]MDD7966784.1 glycosyltransferase family 2 protein [Actinomycetospora sp. DW7H6]
MTAQPTVTVIICAHTMERQVDLEKSVASVEEQTFPVEEIVVVIDHNEELLAWARARFPRAEVVPSRGRRGLSGARNTGVRAATGDILVFLDDDAAAETDWIARLVEHYEDDAVHGVGGGVLPAWDPAPPFWFPAEFNWVIGCSYVGLPTDVRPVRNAIGANMSYRRETFESAGAFTEGLGRVGSLPLGCEETEFGIRVRAALPGARFLYDPRAEVHHTVKRERRTLRYFVRRCYSEGLSKAAVSDLAGATDALSSERGYVCRVLPRGFVRGLVARRSNPAKAAAIALGLATTIAGYLGGRLRSRSRSEPAQTGWRGRCRGAAGLDGGRCAPRPLVP